MNAELSGNPALGSRRNGRSLSHAQALIRPVPDLDPPPRRRLRIDARVPSAPLTAAEPRPCTAQRAATWPLLLRNSIDNAGPVYSELSIHRARIETLGQHIAEKEIAIRLDKSKLNALDGELKGVSALKITSDFLLSGAVGSTLLDQEKIDRLARCINEVASIEAHDQAVHSTQKALTDPMGVHERLISTGLEYLSAWPSHICPLCSASHDSASDLREKVKAQNLLSRLSQENAEKLALSELRRSQLRDEVLAITRAAEEVQLQQIAVLREKFKELSERLARADREKSNLETEKKALEHRISELEKAVWSLSKDELLSRAEGEIRQLSQKRLDLVLRQAEWTEKIDLLNQKISANETELQILASESAAKSTQHSYLLVYKYLADNALSSVGLRGHCEAKMAEIKAEVEQHRVAGETLVAQCNAMLCSRRCYLMAHGLFFLSSNPKKKV